MDNEKDLDRREPHENNDKEPEKTPESAIDGETVHNDAVNAGGEDDFAGERAVSDVDSTPPEPKSVEMRYTRTKKARHKKYRPLWITGIALVAAVVIYFGVITLFPEPEVEEENTPTNTADTLLDFDYDTITSLQFDFSDGYSYTLDIEREKGDTGYTVRNYTIEGKTQFTYSSNSIANMISAVSGVTSSTLVVSNPDDYGAYGLDDPRVKVTYTDINGNAQTLLIGNPAPVGTGSYGMIDGASNVYVIGSYITEYLLKTDMELRDLAITYYEDPTTSVDDVTITKDGSELWIHRLTSDESKSEGLYSSEYRLKEPYDLKANRVYVEDLILSNLSSISAVSVLEDYPTDDELERYGLSDDQNPTYIEITDENGNTVKVTLGKAVPENEDCVYGKVNGVTSVYILTASDFDFASTKYNQLMDVSMWLHTLTDVEYVEMNLDGVYHKLELPYETQTNDEGEDVTVVDGILDGESITDNNARMLYLRVMQLYSYGVIEDDTDIGEVTYSFKIVYYDGSEYTLEFAPISSRRFAIIKDGELTKFYANISHINEIISAIETIREGDILQYTA